MIPVRYLIPEVVGQVPATMFGDVQAAMLEGRSNNDGRAPLGEIRFRDGLSDHEFRLHEALAPLVNIIVERETRRLHKLDISTSFEALGSERTFDTDFWHRDGNTLTRLIGYTAANGTGTEFRVPRRLTDTLESDPQDGPGWEVVGSEGKFSVVRPRPLTVVRFIKHKHRGPIDDSPDAEVRPWVRATLNDFLW